MRISNTRLSVFAALCLSALFCLWFSQQSLNRYWQQTYHRPSPLAALNRFAWWRAGAQLQNAANGLYARWQSGIAAVDQRIAAAAPVIVLPAASDDGVQAADAQAFAEELARQEAAFADAEQDADDTAQDDALPAEAAPAAVPQNDAAQHDSAVNDAPQNNAVAAVEASTETAATPPRKAPLIGARDLTRREASAETAPVAQTAPQTHSAQNQGKPLQTEAAPAAAQNDSAPAVNNMVQSATAAQNTVVSADDTPAQTATNPPRKAPLIGARDLTRREQTVETAPAAQTTSQTGSAPNQDQRPQAEATPATAAQNTAAQNDSAPAVNNAAQSATAPQNTAVSADDTPAQTVANPPRKAPVIGARDLTRSAAPAQPIPATAQPNSTPNQDQRPQAEDIPAAAPQNDAAQHDSTVNDAPQNSAAAAGEASTETAATPPPVGQASIPAAAEQKAAAPAEKAASAAVPDYIRLKAGDKVLLVGDSLMQGVAPYVQQALLQNYNVHSINLSRQSTGLSYPGFFNWPAEVEKALAADAAIKAVVVFMGPNDPWDFPDPEQGDQAPYLKFKSPAWEAVYRSRITRITDAAAAAGADVVWLGLPFMQAEPLNGKLQYLDGVMRSEMRGKGIFVPTKYILTGGAPGYVDSITVDGKTVRVRSKDGIHFTPTGQRQIAVAVLRRLRFGE